MELNIIKDRIWSIFACSAKKDTGTYLNNN